MSGDPHYRSAAENASRYLQLDVLAVSKLLQFSCVKNNVQIVLFLIRAHAAATHFQC